jgi:hypothetical protein
MMKNIFENNSYSKEKYQKLQSEIESEESLLKNALEKNIYSNEGIRNASENIAKLRMRLEKMDNKAHGEALKLNEKYDKLLERAEKALVELHNFQEEQLGMNSLETGGDALKSEPKREIIQASDKNIKEIENVLSQYKLPHDAKQKIIELVYRESVEYASNMLSPDKKYEDVYNNAGSEWRDIFELGRFTAMSIGREELAAEIQKRYPDLEIKVESGGDYKYSPIQVRRTTK